MNLTGDNTRKGNFGDAVFYLDFSDGSAIETGGVEELPDKSINDKEIYNSFKGVLSFEDFWASKGDYDMNDMVVEYKREIYKSVLTSKVVKVIDTFVPKHDGANWQNGFGYQLTGIANSDINENNRRIRRNRLTIHGGARPRAWSKLSHYYPF